MFNERITKYLLLAIGILLLMAFCLFSYIGGDISDTLWRFVLAKVHFANEWSMPYYTPARCGGFLLAADANDLLFTLYMPFSVFVPNVLWAVKITNFVLSMFMALGVFLWLRYFGITNQVVRIFSGILFALSGYWI